MFLLAVANLLVASQPFVLSQTPPQGDPTPPPVVAHVIQAEPIGASCTYLWAAEQCDKNGDNCIGWPLSGQTISGKISWVYIRQSDTSNKVVYRLQVMRECPSFDDAWGEVAIATWPVQGLN
jgi:hypothetical protein